MNVTKFYKPLVDIPTNMETKTSCEVSQEQNQAHLFTDLRFKDIAEKTFDIADEPITEGINFEIDAQSQNADYLKLQEILAIAEEKCPAMYSMQHVIKVNATIR